MSYVIQDGDKFYEMNPKDAREGDEIQVGGGWHVMSAYQLDACLLDNQPRRRLIAPGVGWRILGVEECLPIEYEYTLDGIKWEAWKCDTEPPISVGDCTLQASEGYINIIAIRQRIPVEAGKDAIREALPILTEWVRHLRSINNEHSPVITNLISSLKKNLLADTPVSCKSGSGPVPVESNTGRVICSFCNWTNVGLLNIADTGATPKYICHGCIKRELDKRADPHIQHVIDAARALVDSIATRPWFRCDALTPLESALAALDK